MGHLSLIFPRSLLRAWFFLFFKQYTRFYIYVMLNLHISEASEKIVLTLKELQTLQSPYYLFVFTHIETKTVVSLIKSQSDEESLYTYRYNKFSIATSSLFLNKPVGNWLYDIYEQTSSSNTNPSLADNFLESGRMNLYPATEFEFENYNPSTTFKAYNG